MDIGLKRLILVILSLVGGVAGVFAILAVLDAAYGNVSIETYGAEYAVLTALPLAVFIGIWLDYFLGTRLLADGPAQTAPARPARSAARAEDQTSE